MKNWILIFTTILFCISCKKETIDTSSSICDQKLISDIDLFDTAPDDEFTFNSVAIDGDCLKISFSYGGGCKETKVKLIDSDVESPSSQPMYSIRLSLDDDDDCEAWVTKEVSFDLTPLQRGDSGNAILSLKGWNDSLNYKF